MVDSTFDADTRKEYIDQALKAVNLAEYNLKELCLVESSTAWTETYFRRTSTTEATGGGTGSSVSGVPQMADFPYIDQTYTEVSGVNKIYGAKTILSAKMLRAGQSFILADAIRTISRTVQYAVDVAIEAVMAASFGNTYAITAGYELNAATVANRDPISIILLAMQTIRADSIDPLTEGYIVVNSTDYTYIMNNSKVQNSPHFQNDVASGGKLPKLCGLKVKISEAVSADNMYIVVKGGMVWKENAPLQVITIDNPLISTEIRAAEDGQCQMVSPNHVCKITNTRA